METTGRLLSLDVFRGLTIALMILVNTPGDGRYVYAPLRHAEWHGWTITDAVFPSFVWIVGVAITLSLGKRVGQPLHGTILRRAAVLFGLGVLIYAVPEFSPGTFRILGVLQRIAICYAVTAVLFLHSSMRGQVAVTAALLAGYWAIMRFVAAPGYAAGDLTIEGNIAHYVDRMVLGAHNYAGTKTWDPEGIISTLPAIATCLFGVMAGHILRLPLGIGARAGRLALTGAGLAAAGLLLDPVLPINKNIWTSTFSLWMAGLDFLVFGGLLWLIDGQGVRRVFRPAAVMGMNAIALYLASEFIEIGLHAMHWKKAIFEAVFLPLAAPVNASLLYALSYVALHLGLAYFLHWRKWYFRV